APAGAERAAVRVGRRVHVAGVQLAPVVADLLGHHRPRREGGEIVLAGGRAGAVGDIAVPASALVPGLQHVPVEAVVGGARLAPQGVRPGDHLVGAGPVDVIRVAGVDDGVVGQVVGGQVVQFGPARVGRVQERELTVEVGVAAAAGRGDDAARGA